jgi:hypothetical protein
LSHGKGGQGRRDVRGKSGDRTIADRPSGVRAWPALLVDDGEFARVADDHVDAGGVICSEPGVGKLPVRLR